MNATRRRAAHKICCFTAASRPALCKKGSKSGASLSSNQIKYYELLARYYVLKRQHMLAAHALLRLAERCPTTEKTEKKSSDASETQDSKIEEVEGNDNKGSDDNSGALEQLTLELIQQERLGLSAKLVEKRMVEEDMCARLQQQQEWVSSKKNGRQVKEHEVMKDKGDAQRGIPVGEATADNNLIMDNMAENNKMRQAIEDVMYRTNTYKSELKEADITTLEEKYNALVSDKAGEIEYLQSLEEQVLSNAKLYIQMRGEIILLARERHPSDEILNFKVGEDM
ncbi:hypothetical protein K1719_013495 [Acacia pycnantha]|nr:hypothetical protein K1719_013495 [Acacia pycnantha]